MMTQVRSQEEAAFFSFFGLTYLSLIPGGSSIILFIIVGLTQVRFQKEAAIYFDIFWSDLGSNPGGSIIISEDVCDELSFLVI